MSYCIDKATIGGCDYSLIATQFSKNGTLFDFLLSQYHKQDLLTLELAMTIFAQIVDAVAYMHKKGFAHLDIKLENILVHDDYSIKLNDFDSSQKVSDYKLIGLGTPNSRAPEIRGNYCKDYKAADAFSLGVVLFMLLTLQPLFLEKPQYKQQSLEYFWAHNDSAWKIFRKRNPNAIDAPFQKLINMLVAALPKNRPSIEYLGEFPYIVENTLSQGAYFTTMQKRFGVSQEVLSFKNNTSPKFWSINDHDFFWYFPLISIFPKKNNQFLTKIEKEEKNLMLYVQIFYSHASSTTNTRLYQINKYIYILFQKFSYNITPPPILFKFSFFFVADCFKSSWGSRFKKKSTEKKTIPSQNNSNKIQYLL